MGGWGTAVEVKAELGKLETRKYHKLRTQVARIPVNNNLLEDNLGEDDFIDFPPSYSTLNLCAGDEEEGLPSFDQVEFIKIPSLLVAAKQL